MGLRVFNASRHLHLKDLHSVNATKPQHSVVGNSCTTADFSDIPKDHSKRQLAQVGIGYLSWQQEAGLKLALTVRKASCKVTTEA